MGIEKNEPDMLDGVEDLSLDGSDDATGGAGIFITLVDTTLDTIATAQTNVSPDVAVNPTLTININTDINTNANF